MRKWRQHFNVHPAADVFPMMTDAELDVLAADLNANGLREPIKMIYTGKERQIGNAFAQSTMLVDGRNRLAAMERAGWDMDGCAVKWQMLNYSKGPFNFDAAAYVISLNIHRRHLTKQQQADF